jgi:hypothetical protein
MCVFVAGMLVVWMATNSIATAKSCLNVESAGRDKSGTTRGADGNDDLQMAVLPQHFGHLSFQAEGTGLEPATPCGAPDFESGS